MMVADSAQLKPRSTGRETKAARKSARIQAVSSSNAPVSITSAKPLPGP